MRNLFIVLLFPIFGIAQTVLTPSGDRQKWHTITIEFTAGESYNETTGTNPFTDRRLNVTFTAPSSATYVVPGYFAADGDAAETSATSGTKWHVKFSPDETGEWSYTASFRAGTDVATTYPSSATDGTAHTSIDGDNGTFTIAASDKTGRDFRRVGRLVYDESYYPKFAENDSIFIKVGPDSPENFLGYDDFDDVYLGGGIDYRHDYSVHVGDWQTGDPTWQTTKGKGIIGAINFLADSLNVNSVSFLTMNKTDGDSKDVSMHIDTGNSVDIADYTEFDVSRTAQWEIVFEYAQTKGIFLHFKTQEQENAAQLDFGLGTPYGQLGRERKLYYRELIARFGHHLVLNWNMGEENEGNETYGIVYAAERRAQLTYVKDIDPYNHLRVVHSAASDADQDAMYDSLLGPTYDLDGISMQKNPRNQAGQRVEYWRNESNTAGKKWAISFDESGTSSVDDQATREEGLWRPFLGGAYGVEMYKSGDFATTDYKQDDFDIALTYASYVKDFMNANMLSAIERMERDDGISGTGNFGMKEVDSVYVVYMTNATTDPNMDLGSSGDTFNIKWFDPRNGGSLQDGSVTSVASAVGDQAIGTAPDNGTLDWVVYAVNQNYTGIENIAVTGVTVSPSSASIQAGNTEQLTRTIAPVDATDQTGVWSSNATGVATVNSSGLVTGVAAGSATITYTTNDGSFTDTSSITVTAPPVVQKLYGGGGNLYIIEQ